MIFLPSEEQVNTYFPSYGIIICTHNMLSRSLLVQLLGRYSEQHQKYRNASNFDSKGSLSLTALILVRNEHNNFDAKESHCDTPMALNATLLSKRIMLHVWWRSSSKIFVDLLQVDHFFARPIWREPCVYKYDLFGGSFTNTTNS